MKNKYLKFCDHIAKACGAFAVLALLLSILVIFFLILFYFGFLMVEEAFTKYYSTGTVWDPPLWIPYSSMMIGAALMILQYIAEIIKLNDEQDSN